MLNYAREPKELIHNKRNAREKTPGEVFDSVRDALASESAIHPTCPRCGRVMALDGEYIKQSADKYIAIARCKNHGRILIRLRFRIDDDGKKIMTRTTAPATVWPPATPTNSRGSSADAIEYVPSPAGRVTLGPKSKLSSRSGMSVSP